MKRLGIVGGIGPESTIEYYRSILATYRARVGDRSAPPLVITSIDVHKMLDGIAAGDLETVTQSLVDEVHRLARAGADLALLASNTPHLVFDAIQRQAPIPLISIVEATCAAAEASRLTRVGLFGTRFTMQAAFYRDVFARRGIAVVVPGAEEQEYIHARYVGELIPGMYLDATRRGMLRIAARMRQETGIQGLVLGGTELPLLLRDSTPAGIPFLDTTRIHVEAAVQRLLA
jgi:aspartate racemase